MELRYKLEASIQRDLRHLHKEMPITSDMSISDIRGVMLLNSIFKKFKDEKSDSADEKAIDMFLSCNQRCKDFTFNIHNSFDELVVGEVRQTFWELFSELSLWYGLPSITEILDSGGIGPGANIGAKCYNYYTKLYDSDLSHTNAELLHWYKAWCDLRSPTMSHAETSREDTWGNRLVEGSTLSTVNKNVDISRTIGTEPTLNMLYQKGLGRYLENVLKRRFFIDLSKQPDINRVMAKLGSIDGKFCTIDLRSASDLISKVMLEGVCPKKFFELLQLFRSPMMKVRGEYIDLGMISSMGNGFTFPLQTIIFATVVEAVYKILGIKTWINGQRQYSVFGDDIIVIQDAYHLVLRALSIFGFEVNFTKSFSTGYFRESCGHDYYRGHNVRGFYCKSLKTQANINSTYNGLYEWQLKSGIILNETVSLLKKYQQNTVPLYEDAEAGFYHSNPPKRYKALVRVPNTFRIDKLPYRQHYNADGVLQAFVGGYITSGTVSLRSEKPRYQIVSRAHNGSHFLAPTIDLRRETHPWIVARFQPGKLRNQLSSTDVLSVGPLVDEIN